MPFRPSSLLRAAGPAVAVLLPSGAPWRRRSLVTAGSYAASAVVDPAGIQLVSVDVHGSRAPAWVARISAPATATVSWVAAQQLLVPAVRRLPAPRPVAALLYGALLYVADDRLAALGRSAARKVADAETATAAAREPVLAATD